MTSYGGTAHNNPGKINLGLNVAKPNYPIYKVGTNIYLKDHNTRRTINTSSGHLTKIQTNNKTKHKI